MTDEKERLHTSLIGVRTKQQLDDTICAFVDKVRKKESVVDLMIFITPFRPSAADDYFFVTTD